MIRTTSIGTGGATTIGATTIGATTIGATTTGATAFVRTASSDRPYEKGKYAHKCYNCDNDGENGIHIRYPFYFA